MKKILSIYLTITFFLFNFSCAQDLKPLDNEREDSIIVDEKNYEMEVVFEDENLIWGLEILDDNSIIEPLKFADKTFLAKPSLISFAILKAEIPFLYFLVEPSFRII